MHWFFTILLAMYIPLPPPSLIWTTLRHFLWFVSQWAVDLVCRSKKRDPLWQLADQAHIIDLCIAGAKTWVTSNCSHLLSDSFIVHPPLQPQTRLCRTSPCCGSFVRTEKWPCPVSMRSSPSTLSNRMTRRSRRGPNDWRKTAKTKRYGAGKSPAAFSVLVFSYLCIMTNILHDRTFYQHMKAP